MKKGCKKQNFGVKKHNFWCKFENPKIECSTKVNLSENVECAQCSSGYKYSPSNTFTSTVVTQFDWVCDTSIMPASSISTSVIMIGLLFGALGFGNLSGKFTSLPPLFNIICFL